MSKRKADCTPEEWEREKAASRERNRRYLARLDAAGQERRSAASRRYRERLCNDPSYAQKLGESRAASVVRTARWQKENPEKVKAQARSFRQRYPDREAAKVQRRNAAKLLAIPPWADHSAIRRHYENARYLTQVTGHMHHVDHILPLRGETVCGLHVENNLRVIPHFRNTRKGNKLVGV